MKRGAEECSTPKRTRISSFTANSVPAGFRFRGLEMLQEVIEDEQQSPQESQTTVKEEQCGRKRFLSDYEHLDLTNPRNRKRQQMVGQTSVTLPDIQLELDRQYSSIGSSFGDTLADEFLGKVKDCKMRFEEEMQELFTSYKNSIKHKISQVQEQLDNIKHGRKVLENKIAEVRQELELTKQQCQVVERERDTYKNRFEQFVKCQICFDRNRNVVLMPCRHFLYCSSCLTQHQEANGKYCPYCRCDMEGNISVIW
eukprot:TRINITY_DN11176_c0_g1_i7.p2 TRINITY_DN11176_c0_g1~~TRINITY_DN11176_c0_g1_i7.p2  ORF type:complete len:255 (-),score=28.18 TRINITY_DN11176_c0_g1_i7:667-1431(-)